MILWVSWLLFYKEISQSTDYSLVHSILMQIKCTHGDHENTGKCISSVIGFIAKIDKWVRWYNFRHNEYNVSVGLQKGNAFCKYYSSWHEFVESKTLNATSLHILIFNQINHLLIQHHLFRQIKSFVTWNILIIKMLSLDKSEMKCHTKEAELTLNSRLVFNTANNNIIDVHHCFFWRFSLCFTKLLSNLENYSICWKLFKIFRVKVDCILWCKNL